MSCPTCGVAMQVVASDCPLCCAAVATNLAGSSTQDARREPASPIAVLCWIIIVAASLPILFGCLISLEQSIGLRRGGLGEAQMMAGAAAFVVQVFCFLLGLPVLLFGTVGLCASSNSRRRWLGMPHPLPIYLLVVIILPIGAAIAGELRRNAYRHEQGALDRERLAKEQRVLAAERAGRWVAPGIRFVAISADGRTMANNTFDEKKDAGFVKLRDVSTGKIVRELDANSVVAISRGGKKVAVTSNDSDEVSVWDIDSGVMQTSVHSGHNINDVGEPAVALSPDGKTLLTANRWQLKSWDAKTGAAGLTFQPEDLGATDITFSGDGKMIAAYHSDRAILSLRLWDAATPVPKLSIDALARIVALNTDGKRLAYADPWAVHVVDTPTGKKIRDLEMAEVLCLQFGSEGMMLGAVSWKKGRVTFISWDVESAVPKCRREFTVPSDIARPAEVALSPDLQFLFIADNGRGLLLRFDLKSGKEIKSGENDP